MRVSLRSNARWQAVQTAGSTGIDLLVLLILAAHFDAGTFGKLAVALSGCKIAFLLVEPRIHEFLTPKLARYGERHPRAAGRWTLACLRVDLASNVCGTALCLVAAAVIGLVDRGYGVAALCAACGVYTGAGALLKFTSLAILRSIGRTQVAAMHALAGGLAKLAALGVAFQLSFGIVATLVTMALPAIAVALHQTQVARRLLRVVLGGWPTGAARSLSRRNRVRQMKLLLSNYATGFVEIGHRELDVQLLALLAGTTVAGGYRLAKSIAMVMLEALNPAVLLLLPEFSRRIANIRGGDLHVFSRRVGRMLFGIASVTAVLVFLGAALYLWFLAPKQWASWRVVAIFVTGFAATAPALWAQAFLVANGRPDVYLGCSIAGVITAIAFCLILIPGLSSIGCAAAHVAGLAVTNGLARRAASARLDGLVQARMAPS